MGPSNFEKYVESTERGHFFWAEKILLKIDVQICVLQVNKDRARQTRRRMLPFPVNYTTLVMECRVLQ